MVVWCTLDVRNLHHISIEIQCSTLTSLIWNNNDIKMSAILNENSMRF